MVARAPRPCSYLGSARARRPCYENTEVLMKRDSRISRALVSAVGITLTLALVFWAYNLGKSHGVASNPSPQPRALAAIVDPALTAQSTLQPPTTPPAAIATAATSQPTTPTNALLIATTQRSADGAGAQLA